ncbi:MbtH family protein [Streptomyces sp. NPDC001793]|uniref:MbtH family protein n=1 Tax=Streptomyces sp. NPDC001793 TaxID=3154657 RepID=UPI003321DEA7
MFEDDDDRQYTVVRNHEDQYSLWPADRPAPAGWEPVGVTGPKSARLSHISTAWTDLRPLSLRS